MQKSGFFLVIVLAFMAVFLSACSWAVVSPATTEPKVSPTATMGETGQPTSAPTSAVNTVAPTPAPATTTEPDVFCDGIYIDDIPLTGLTRQEALQKIEDKQLAVVKAIGVTLKFGDRRWSFTSANVTYTVDTTNILAQAWNESNIRYMAKRYVNNEKLAEHPSKFYTEVKIDPSSLEETVRTIAYSLYVPFVDSAYAGYDVTKPDGQRLIFTPDQPGKQIDADALWAEVKQRFENKTFGTIELTYTPVQAKITTADWLAHMKLLNRFTSAQKDHTAARMTNVRIACAAITNHMILPGETFSFNDTTGPRTAEKGYQEAHVINGGVIDNGLAGGVCQVSGTLFNAAARADLDIVDRQAHSLRSSYLPLGQDATVDYGHYDLKIKNNTDSPVLIIMYIGTGKDQYNVFAEIYGTPLPNGETIDLFSQITATIPAPATVTYAPSEAVKPGTTELVKPHDGLKVTTYKVYSIDGKETKRVILNKDYYKEAGTIIVYNPADPVPTPTPAITPSPSPASSPKPGATPTKAR